MKNIVKLFSMFMIMVGTFAFGQDLLKLSNDPKVIEYFQNEKTLLQKISDFNALNNLNTKGITEENINDFYKVFETNEKSFSDYTKK